MCTDSGSHIRSPLPNWSSALAPFLPVMDLHGWQKALWKSRPVDISQSVVASYTDKLGNKINFNLYANMSGFCSDIHIYVEVYFVYIVVG